MLAARRRRQQATQLHAASTAFQRTPISRAISALAKFFPPMTLPIFKTVDPGQLPTMYQKATPTVNNNFSYS